MQNVIKSIVLILSFSTAIILPNNTNAAPDLNTAQTIQSLFSNVYTWAPEAGAVNYKVDLVNVGNGQSINFETTETQICLAGVPVATYAVTVKAELANGSSYIIVEELIDM